MSVKMTTPYLGKEITNDKYVDTGEYTVVSIINGQRTQVRKILEDNPNQITKFLEVAKIDSDETYDDAIKMIASIVEKK